MKSRVSYFFFVLSIIASNLCFGQSSSEQISRYTVVAKNMEKRLKYDSAFLYYDSALLAAQQLDDSVYINYVNNLIGASLLSKSEIDSAKVMLTKVWTFAVKNRNDTLRVLAENNLGRVSNYKKLMGFALKYYESALDVSKKVKYDKGSYLSYCNLTDYYLDQEEYNLALDYALKAIRLADNKQFSQDDYMKSIFNLGNVYEKFAFYDSAEICYRKVTEHCVKNGNLYLATNSLSNTALIYMRLGSKEFNSNRIEKANEYFLKARDLTVECIKIVEPIANYQLLANQYNTLSISYKKLGDYSNALKNYQQALEYANLANDPGNQVRILKNIGMLYRSQGDYKTAKKYFLESMELAKKTEYKMGVMEAYNSLSVMYEMTGDYKEAFINLSNYLEIKNSIIAQEKIQASQEMLFAFEREKDRELIKDLENQNKINQLESENLKFEKRAVYSVSASVIVILLFVLLYLRMKARKNRIIDAQRIQQLEDEKKLLAAQSVILGQENERKRIAQELHDGIGILLSTASLQFSGISSEIKDAKTIEIISKASKSLKEAGQEVRKISQNMMPSVLLKFGLREALEDLFEDVEESGKIETNILFDTDKVRLSENMEIMLYRVVQEMVNNTIKHAEATKVTFSFVKKPTVIEIDFSDNGKGFDPNNLPRDKNLGIFGLRSRVDFLKSTLELKSSPGQGTYYHFNVPLGNKT